MEHITCPDCKRFTVRDTSSRQVVYICRSCQRTFKGGENSSIVYDVDRAAGSIEQYAAFVRNASRNITNKRSDRMCPKCGVMFMVEVRLGHDEYVTHLCDCEFVSPAPLPSVVSR